MLERYNPMLNAIKKLCPTAHIAGGAVRDTLLERPIKDIDLFLDDSAINKAAALLRSQFGFMKTGEWEHYGIISDPAVARVAKFETACETIPVALIGLNHEWREERTMQENLGRFDFGICMAGWDGDEVYVAPEYKVDVAAKTFTLCRADDDQQFAYSMRRFEKMTKERYAGWSLEVPTQFKKLEFDHVFGANYYVDDDGVTKLRDHGKPVQLLAKAR